MEQHLEVARDWVKSSVRRRCWIERMTALGMVGVALLCFGFWWVCVVGTLTGLAFIVSIAGIRLPNPMYVGLGVLLVQMGLFPFVRRAPQPTWRMDRTADTDEPLLIAPDHSGANMYWYNQDHDFSFKRVYLALFFCVPIALDEAWRHWRLSMHFGRVDREGLARLAAWLLERQSGAPLTELELALGIDNFDRVIEQAASLPGYHVIPREPQLIRLTEDAEVAMLVRPHEVAA